MKKLSSTGATISLLLLLVTQNTVAQTAEAHPESRTIFQKELLSGIGTTQTTYSSPMPLEGKCKEKVTAYLHTQTNIQSFEVQPHSLIINWVEPVTDNVIFFFEKLEFQYIFPYSSAQ